MVGVIRIMALLLAVIAGELLSNDSACFCTLRVYTVSAAAECPYGASPPVATIGQEMVIKCNLLLCFKSVYEWCKVNGAECIKVQDETSDELVVSENVSSATEVGGQQYECHCSGSSSNCKKYKIAGT